MLLVIDTDHLETILAVFELILVITLLNVVLEKVRNLDILSAILAVADKSTLFSEMKVI